MREIKFRLWSKEYQEMFDMKHLTAMYTVSAKLDKEYIPEINESDVDMPLTGIMLPFHDDAVLMQYTGLKDKNGTEIYEGDIIQTYFSFSPGDAGYGVSQKPFIVTWDRERGAFRGKKPKPEHFHLLNIIDFFQMQSQLYEVIGNIYENPELREGLRNEKG